jgi:hypothetical protein
MLYLRTGNATYATLPAMQLSNLKFCTTICWTKTNYFYIYFVPILFTFARPALKHTLKELYWRRCPVKCLSINSFPVIYFRVCVQFNQLFITISCFWKHKTSIVCMTTSSEHFVSSPVCWLPWKPLTTQCVRGKFDNHELEHLSHFFTFTSFCRKKEENSPPEFKHSRAKKKKTLPAFLHAFDFVKWPFLERKMNGSQNS